MATTLLGTKQDGVVHFRGDRWWAEAGLIHCEEGKNGNCRTIPVPDMLRRMQALNDMIGNSRAHPDGVARHTDEVVEMQDYLEAMVRLCTQAQSQGRPDDPAAVSQIRRENKGRTRYHVVPGMNTIF
jgi:hypothetical protein